MIDIRKLGWKCGNYKSGRNNAILDVPGVKVSHYTIIEGEGKLIPGKGPVRTGLTMIFPHEGNCFLEKTLTGVYVANGYGKLTGIPQILETGVIETPIAITNTLNVGIVFDALVTHAITENHAIGIKTGSVSPIVAECFDGYLNDIQGRHVKASHVFETINTKHFTNLAQGNVGAGTGMQVFELKSGVGMASRQVPKGLVNDVKTYHIGVLVVPNFGYFKDFNFYGVEMASILNERKYLIKENNPILGNIGGSIIVVIATDLPLNSRQLNRLACRGALGIARTGSILAHRSGDFIIAFSTQNRIAHDSKDIFIERIILNDNGKILADAFRMTIEAVQEAIYNAMLSAESMTGRDSHKRIALDLNDLPNPESINK